MLHHESWQPMLITLEKRLDYVFSDSLVHLVLMALSLSFLKMEKKKPGNDITKGKKEI